MKILELFSGYGTASFALKRLGIPYEIVGYSDIDKYANQCFAQNHGGKQLGDVKLINPNDLEDFDLLTAGFPCQAFSNAGKMQGEADPRGTLFYEIIRIAEVKQPKYMLLENVKGLTSKKFKDTFNKILSELDRIGYNVYWKVLNSKDYGIPQSRARVWFVCFRKNIDKKDFKFPEPVELKIFIKDILEQEVDSKYYLSPLLQERFAKYLKEKQGKTEFEKDGVLYDLNINPNEKTRDVNQAIEYALNKSKEEGQPVQLDLYHLQHGEIRPLTTYVPQDNKVHRCLQAGEPKEILVYDRKGFDSRTKGFRESELSPTLSTKMGTGENNVPMVANCIKVGGLPTKLEHYYEKKHSNIAGESGALRRLTPKECFRLMGFLNDEINLEGLSDTQRYKLAGNGQSVNVVAKIFERMFK